MTAGEGQWTGLWRIVLPYACFGICENALGVVVRAPPIAKWCVGKRIEQVLGAYRRKGAQVEATWYDALL